MSPSPHLPSSAGFAAGFVDAVLDFALTGPQRRPVFGIAGMQGTGKSTLAQQLLPAARRRGLHAVALSIDDFYLGRRERLVLGHNVHPLLATRGPPGTHDVNLACLTLAALQSMRSGDAVPLPRFDKISDRRLPPSRWPVVRAKPDLIMLEGWLLKVPAQSPAQLRKPVNALEQHEDVDGSWRRYCNDALRTYAPLWQKIDRLLFLQGPGFELVPQWRWQQEQALQAANPQRRAMTRAQVERFVLFFERVSRQALRTLPGIAERTVRIDKLRLPIA